MSDDTIGVLGATGQQGGAVIDALLARDRRVRVLVRDPRSDGAEALARRGVEVATADQDEPDSLAGPLTGLASLFLMTTFTDASGTAGETRRGRAVVDAAASAGVPRLVQSSVGGADRHSGIPHFESKWQIEQHARATLPTVVVRPVYFMDNLAMQLPDTDGGTDDDDLVIRMAMPGEVPLQLVAVADIGRVAAAALIDADALGGDALEIAGDELTGNEIAARIGRQLSRPARYEAVTPESLGDDDLAAMFRWFTDTPAYQGDVARTREVDPELLDLDGWLASRQA